jgi:small subunit ribosomal protein S4
MKKIKKKYETPPTRWNKERIEVEKVIIKNFGLRRKKEIYRAQAILRKYRRMARELTASSDKVKEKLIIGKLIKLGLLNEGATLDDILSLTVENILDRRLQSILLKKGLANTAKHARQMIVHGHVSINGRKVVYPSYLVLRGEEEKIQKVN